MNKYIIIIFYISIVIYLMKINNYLFDHFIDPLDYSKVNNYNEGYNKLKKRDYPPQYGKVILFILDGARKDCLYNKEISPNIVKRWEERGVRFTNVYTMLPSVSAPNYFSILSGAPVYLHGVTNNYRRYPQHQRTNTIFEHLSNYGFTSSVIGFNWHKDLFKNRTIYMPAECCERDDAGEVLDILARLIESRTLPSFTVVHFLGPDNAAHATGSNKSRRYIDSIATIDRLMDNIFPIIEKNYPNSLSIITSDHGMNIDGNHGGSDEESLRVPLYFIARDLKSQEIHREIYNISIVPTLSAIFGIPIPNFSSAGPIYEIIDSDRRLDYLYESIDKKEKIIEVMEGIEARSFIMNKDLMESITNHDKELTERILDYKGRYIDNILMNQRIIAIILFILFIIWAIYKTESGIPLLLILSSLLPLLMGFSMDLINSRNVYDISIAIYLLSLSAIAFYYTLSFDNPILFDKRHPLATFLPLLSLLMIPNIIIAGFFIPFHTLSPDENIFAFRFFSISFIHPPLFLSLLVFMDWIKRESGGDIQEGVSLAPDEDEERDHSD